MKNNELLNNCVHSYSKSPNHKIIWRKNDKINTCDLNAKCSKLEFSISKNKFVNYTNYANNIIDISATDNFEPSNIVVKQEIICNYDGIIFFLTIILIVILVLKFNGKK